MAEDPGGKKTKEGKSRRGPDSQRDSHWEAPRRRRKAIGNLISREQSEEQTGLGSFSSQVGVSAKCERESLTEVKVELHTVVFIKIQNYARRRQRWTPYNLTTEPVIDIPLCLPDLGQGEVYYLVAMARRSQILLPSDMSLNHILYEPSFLLVFFLQRQDSSQGLSHSQLSP